MSTGYVRIAVVRSLGPVGLCPCEPYPRRMTDGDDELRSLLLDHSDHRAVRNVFGAYTDSGTATLSDYVEAMRASDGALAVVANDGAAEVYARWNGSGGRFEHLTIWPPWTIGGYGHTDGDRLASFLEETEAVRPTPHSETPFEDQQVLASLSHRIRP